MARVEENKKKRQEYITYIEDVKADKKKLYEDLKAGTEINGAHLKANRGTTIK